MELQLVHQGGDAGVPLYLDNVRLTVQPRDMIFDVYMEGVEFPRPAQNVRFYARHVPYDSFVRDTYGLSEPFDVVESKFCLALLGANEVREVDGTVELHVTIGAALSSDLVLHLRSSHPLAATLPATVTIPAGATEAVVTVQILDNNLVEGRKAIAFFAEAENYTPAVLPVTLTDDEIPTLRFKGPFAVREGDRTQIAIEASRAPDTNVMIHVTSNPNRGVRDCLLEAGQTQTSFEIFNDFYIDGDVSYHFKAEFQIGFLERRIYSWTMTNRQRSRLLRRSEFRREQSEKGTPESGRLDWPTWQRVTLRCN